MILLWNAETRCWVGETEVSFRQLRICSLGLYMDDGPYVKRQPGYTPDWPAMNIEPYGALKFCRWMNRCFNKRLPAGYEFRLPTKEEWETVARCGDGRKYPWGNDWPPVAMADGQRPNLSGGDLPAWATTIVKPREPHRRIADYTDGHAGPAPVKMAGRNERGICGLAGNVAEWVFLPTMDDYALKGQTYMDYHSEALLIATDWEKPPKPWPFFPWIQDRRSSYVTGFRVVAGPVITRENGKRWPLRKWPDGTW